jgi:hypothetical protein
VITWATAAAEAHWEKSAANTIFTLLPGPRTGTIFDLDWPCLVGIVLSAIPDGDVIAVSRRHYTENGYGGQSAHADTAGAKRGDHLLPSAFFNFWIPGFFAGEPIAGHSLGKNGVPFVKIGNEKRKQKCFAALAPRAACCGDLTARAHGAAIAPRPSSG